MSGLEIRSVTEEEFPAFARAVAFQFGEDVHDDDIPRWRALSDLERTRAVFDGERIVATADTLTFSMAVPGGRVVPCGGLTSVGVRTTHRRRGLLTRLMREHLADAVDRREPVTALYASEAPIYGRFGYGPAAPTIGFTLRRDRGRIARPTDLVAHVDFAEPAADLTPFMQVYEAVHPTVPGLMGRDERWWEYLLGAGSDEERHREGYGSRYTAVLPHRGYVTYRIKEGWTDNLPDGELLVTELVAADPEAYAALWQFCLSVDLMSTVRAQLRPPDEPLPFLLTDSAAFSSRASDPMYVRLLDLPGALEARGYAVADALVLDVADDFWPENSGRWRLDAGPDGATCERTTAEPDLMLDTSSLATAYLGGERMTRLLRAGRVLEQTPGAAARADLLLAADRLPWNAQIF